MLSQRLNAEFGKQLFRYTLAGGLNTAIGFAVIIGLLGAGIKDVPANAFGYAVGLLVSFFVNRSWTFSKTKNPDAREISMFLATFAIAYGVNLAIVLVGQSLGFGGNPLLHLTGVIAYSAVGFLFARNFVYSENVAGGTFRSVQNTGGILTCAGVACLIFPGMAITHDVVWQFWIARQMNHGVELYSQINEVNPPLWFWMAMPLDLFASWFAFDPIVIVQLAMIFLSAISCFLADRLLPGMATIQRRFFIVNAFALGLFLAFGNFAQREQIAMISALPYILLIVGRVQGDHVSPRMALAVGLFAAPGFALKHFFIAIPLLLELWLIFVQRSKYRPFRSETLALLATAVAYILAIMQFAPAYISQQIPMVMAAYDGYKKPFNSLINDREQLIWLVAVIAFVRYGSRRTGFMTPLAIGLLIAMFGFLFSYGAQGKGWVYHSMPVSYCLLLALIAAIANGFTMHNGRKPYYLACSAIALGYILPVSSGAYSNRYGAATEAAIAGTPKGVPIYILSSDAQKGWPMVVANGYVWSSRFMGLWMLPAVAAKLGDETELENISTEVRTMILEDLQCNPPALLLADRAVINGVLRPLNFDFMAYFVRDPGAKKFMTNYYLADTSSKFYIYKRRAGSKIETPVNCRKIY